jgi:hypothetical protein
MICLPTPYTDTSKELPMYFGLRMFLYGALFGILVTKAMH